jgi:hypothetical protein
MTTDPKIIPLQIIEGRQRDFAAELDAQAKAQGKLDLMAMAKRGFLDAKAKSKQPPSSSGEVLGAAKPKPAKPALPLREWSEVAVPEGASALEALTYVPGLVGDITEWIVRGARRPNRMMALAVANVVVGTLIGRRIEGPTGSATHLYVILLAPTGYGKDRPLHAGAVLMDALGLSDLLGPHEWASAPGFEKLLKTKPLMICFVDELGDELSKVNKSGNDWLKAVIGLFKKCYNAWAIVLTASKVSDDSVRIEYPAPSIIGAATPEKFFEALQPGDLESGFANRLLILPFEGYRRPPEQSPAADAQSPPKSLLAGLKALPKQTTHGEQILSAPLDGSARPRPPTERIGWGPGAEEVYLAFSGEVDALEDGDRQRYELAMRAGENAVRFATNIAVGRGSPTVDREDITHAIALSRQSLDAACGGVTQYMHEHFEFPKFCDRVLDFIACGEDGFASRRDIERKFRGNVRHGFEMQNVLDQLKREKRIEEANRTGQRGPAAGGYRIIPEEGEGG